MSEQESLTPSSTEGSLVHASWRVQVCRWLWRVLVTAWGVISAIIVGTLIAINTTTSDKPPSTFYLVQMVRTYPLQTGAILGILLILTGISLIGSRERDQSRRLSPSQQNRLHMLERLHHTYDDVLKDSLQGAAWLELGFDSQPDAVQSVSRLLLRTSNQPGQLLPIGISIVEVYEQANHELLILGEPGTGKSTLLLHLALHLTEQAKQDMTFPLPVIFRLSTWAVKRPALEIWLVEQLRKIYAVPRSLAEQWVRDEQILPLLDGLDEMKEQARPDCIVAINIYHQDHLLPLVVCSRRSEYQKATTSEQLALQNAVVVQELTQAQVDTYLIQAGKPLSALHRALRHNPALKELARTPLMLHILILTYQGTAVRQLSQKEVELQQHIWTDYVRRMLDRKKEAQHYPPHQIIAWLGFLARQMQDRNQTLFYLEQLQPDWLDVRQRIFYRLSVVLLLGLISGLIFGLIGVLIDTLSWWTIVGLINGLIFGLIDGLIHGLVVGLIGGLIFGLKAKIEPAEELTWTWKNWRSRLNAGLVVGLVVGLIFGLVIGSISGPIEGLAAGLTFGLVVGLIGGLVFGFSGKQLIERLLLSPNEGIRRSLKNGLIAGLVSGLFFWLSLGLIHRLISELSVLSSWLLPGMVFGLIFGLLAGLGATTQHYTLRILLWRTHTFPWKMQQFLDDAVTCILLRRVGGGYSFIHRLLLDYLADLPTSPPSTSATRSPAPGKAPPANKPLV